MYGKYGPLYVQIVFFFFQHLSVFIKMNTDVFRPLCEVLSN